MNFLLNNNITAIISGNKGLISLKTHFYVKFTCYKFAEMGYKYD